MPAIYTLSVWRHPIRAVSLWLRRTTLAGLRRAQLRDDAAQTSPTTGDFDGGVIAGPLQQFTVGESLPWKGVRFKVGKVVGGPLPCVILVPVDVTHGRKLQTMRAFRQAAQRRA